MTSFSTFETIARDVTPCHITVVSKNKALTHHHVIKAHWPLPRLDDGSLSGWMLLVAAKRVYGERPQYRRFLPAARIVAPTQLPGID